MEKTEPKILVEDLPIYLLAEVAVVVKKFLELMAPSVNDIHQQMLKVLDIVGLSWLTHIFGVLWKLGTYLMSGRPGWWFSFFKKRDPIIFLQLLWYHTVQAIRENFIPQY